MKQEAGGWRQDPSPPGEKAWGPNISMWDHREPSGEVWLDWVSSRLEPPAQGLQKYSLRDPMQLQS